MGFRRLLTGSKCMQVDNSLRCFLRWTTVIMRYVNFLFVETVIWNNCRVPLPHYYSSRMERLLYMNTIHSWSKTMKEKNRTWSLTKILLFSTVLIHCFSTNTLFSVKNWTHKNPWIHVIIFLPFFGFSITLVHKLILSAAIAAVPTVAVIGFIAGAYYLSGKQYMKLW